MNIRPLVTPVALVALLALSESVGAATPTLFDRIGIGADWGPHWAASPSAGDLRDNQADGAFPAEICLLRNAGFKTIRMYGENATTWIAVLDAVESYNRGTLDCNPGGPPPQDCTATNSCMSVVYQVAMCGPDPRSLAWNGSYSTIDQVKCYQVEPGGSTPVSDEPRFTDSLDEEMVKLAQVISYAGAKFAANVPLVLVGNEILFSAGTCSAGGSACTDNRDCGAGSCNIGHYCSDTLDLSNPLNPNITWANSWATCNYQVGGVATAGTNVFFPRGYLATIPKWPPLTACPTGLSSVADPGACGPPPAIPVSFDGRGGFALDVGVADDEGHLWISGRFHAPVIRLDRATATIESLLEEGDGVGELSRRPGGASLVPIELAATAESRSAFAKYQTAPRARPSVALNVWRRDTASGATEFLLRVDRDSMPLPPAGCTGSEVQLRTAFTLYDGSAPPLAIQATLPWQCRGEQLRLR